MRLALVGLTHPFRGGIAHYTTLLCGALAERHSVRFFALSRQYPTLLFPGTTQRDDSTAALRVPADPCLDSINPLSWFATARRIRRFEPELVLFSWWHPFFAPAFGTVARLARRRGGPPSCFLCHNVLPHEATPIDRLLLRYAFAPASAFITHSNADREHLERLRPGAVVRQSPHPTYAAFRPTDVPTSAAARAALGIAPDRHVVLFFGFVRAYKGLGVLLEALGRLPAEPAVHLLVAGEFYEDRAKYAAPLATLAERGRLTLVDRYVSNEELPRFFAAADLVAVPYLTATQSGIVQLAYAFDRPVVATTVGGLPEVVAEGRTGYLVAPGDAGALAAAVLRHFASEDPAKMRRNIAAERDRYSWERMVEAIESVSAELVARSGGAARATRSVAP